jgi:hypothetical protein
LRLLLLADEPEWAALLRACMPALGGSAVLMTAPNWEAVDSLFDDRQAVCWPRPACSPPLAVAAADHPAAGTRA